METLSALMTLCREIPLVTGGSVMRSFDIFFILNLSLIFVVEADEQMDLKCMMRYQDISHGKSGRQTSCLQHAIYFKDHLEQK